MFEGKMYNFFILDGKKTIEALKEILKNKVYSSLHDWLRERMARIIDPTTYVTTILNLCKKQNEANKT